MRNFCGLLCVLCVLVSTIDCQVTFSRDWNAGKRSNSMAESNFNRECAALWRTIITLGDAITVSICISTYLYQLQIVPSELLNTTRFVSSSEKYPSLLCVWR